MITPLDLFLLALAAVFLGPPILWAWRLVSLYLSGTARATRADDPLPLAAVILPLRGDDPSLGACLRALLGQDYPRYHLLIVIDSPADPAWGAVRRALAAGHGPNVEVRVESLAAPCATCSLKLSAQLQAVANLPGGAAVVALVDADAVVPPDWLRRLAAPFANPRVGAVSGVRWFAPARPALGSLVRHLWNCGCQTQVYAFGIPWGGTMALRAELFAAHGLAGAWRHRFADDTAAADLLRRLGLRVCFVPELTIVNREAMSLGAVARFARRQVLNTRLDLAAWPLLLAFNVGMTLALALAVGAVAVGLATGDGARVGWYGGLLALHFGGLLSALGLAEYLIRRQARRRGGRLPAVPVWKYPVAVVLAVALQGYAIAAAACARRVRWRGVEYEVERGRVRLLQYRPYRTAAGAETSGRSID